MYRYMYMTLNDLPDLVDEVSEYVGIANCMHVFSKTYYFMTFWYQTQSIFIFSCFLTLYIVN